MATKNIVPRSNNEGELGTSNKQWNKVHAKEIYENGTRVATADNVPPSIGSSTIPTYTNASGVVTASNASVGDANTPVYLNAGEITSTGKSFGDYLPLAGGTMTGDILYNDAPLIPIENNAGAHNAIYRGKSLGSSVTADQWAEIKAGTFKDLFIGDYWTINSVTWRIAGFDYWYNTGYTACATHHVVIVPDTNLASAKMNSTNITTGAYIGSDYYTGTNSNTGKATAKAAIEAAFGASHILSHREYLKNAVTNGYESAGAWYDSTFELMTEQMVYGCQVFTNVMNGTNIPAGHTIDNAQLPLFRHRHDLQCIRADWWLRSVASGTSFANVNPYGNASYTNASGSLGICPAFAIYQS